MTVNQCLQQLLEVEEERKGGVCGPEARAVGLARVGQPTQCVRSGTIAQLLACDFGAPLHSVVLVGEVDEIEERMLQHFAVVGGVGVGV
jgi:diphthine synthase